jgi:transcriptional regulator with XRE-family HTH domain
VIRRWIIRTGDVAEIRYQRGMTQPEPAQMAGLSQHRLAKPEIGRTKVPLERLPRIPRRLGATVPVTVDDRHHPHGT